MIVDSSALLAVILNEADEPRFAAAMIDAPTLRMSAANWVEAAIVVDSRGIPLPGSGLKILSSSCTSRSCRSRRRTLPEPRRPTMIMVAAGIERD